MLMRPSLCRYWMRFMTVQSVVKRFISLRKRDEMPTAALSINVSLIIGIYELRFSKNIALIDPVGEVS